MARKDPDSERRRRGLDDLEKALRRGDVDLALASLDKLRDGVPAAALDTVGSRLRRVVLDAHRTAQWSRLHDLAVRSERFPALLERGASAAQADACRWALLWGCLRSRDLARARSQLQAFAACLGESPALARCLTEIVDGEGTLSDALVSAVPAALRPPSSQQPGGESLSARRVETPRAPATAETAREAVLLAAHRLTLPALAESLQRWLEQASSEVAAAIRTAALPVARREMLRRFHDGAPLGPAVRVLLAATRSVDRSSEEVDRLVEGVRLAGERAGAVPDVERDADGFARLGGALLREPAFGALGARWLLSRTQAAPASPGLHRFYERVLDAHPHDFELWTLMCRALVAPEGDDAPPSWLWEKLEPLCVDATTLARGWATIPPDGLDPLFDALTLAIPLPLGVKLVERSWAAATPALRLHLCTLVAELCDEGFGEFGLDSLDGMNLDESLTAMGVRMQKMLAAPVRALWSRLGDELLEADPHLINYAIQAAGSSLAEQTRCLLAWLDGRGGVEPFLVAFGDVLRVPAHGDALSEVVFDRMLTRFEADADVLARALRWLDGRAPVPTMGRLAAALIAATPRRVQDRSMVVRQALARARQLTRAPGRARKPNPKQRRTIEGDPERAAAPARRLGKSRQVELDLFPDSTRPVAGEGPP
jgi:hypothetical protein